MLKFTVFVALCLFSLVSILHAQEKKCDMHEKICGLAKDDAGKMKFKTCFEASAPIYFRDITNNCKKEFGEEATPVEELIVKICSEDNKELAKNIGKCKKAGLEDEGKKNPNMKTELEPFMKCLG